MSSNEEDIGYEALVPLYPEENDNMGKAIKLCPECGREYDPSKNYSECCGKPLYLAWECRECGEGFRKYPDSSEIRHCPKCGSELTGDQRRIVNAGRSKVLNPSKARFKCPKCGREYPVDVGSCCERPCCGTCGEVLEKLACKKCGEPYQQTGDGKYNKYCTVCGNMTTMHPDYPPKEPDEPNNGKNGDNGGGGIKPPDPKKITWKPDKKTVIILAALAAAIIIMIMLFKAIRHSGGPEEPPKTNVIYDSGAMKQKFEEARKYRYSLNNNAEAARLYKEVACHSAEDDKYGIAASRELKEMYKKEVVCP